MAQATLLSIVQNFCRRRGLPVPGSVMSSQDDMYLQIAGLMDEGIESMLTGFSWQQLQYITTFTSVAAESQGTLTTLCPEGFLSIINETIYDRTRRLPIYGPKTPQEWEMLQALTPTGPLYQFRILQDSLRIFPTMPAGHTLAFEYNSEYAIYNPVDLVYKKFFTKDTDEFLLNDTLKLKWLTWRWLSVKGFPYAEEQRLYEEYLGDLRSKNKAKATLSLAGDVKTIRPGILVPAGSWSIP